MTDQLIRRTIALAVTTTTYAHASLGEKQMASTEDVAVSVAVNPSKTPRVECSAGAFRLVRGDGEVFTFRGDLGKRGLAGDLTTGYAGADHTIWR